jgi:protein-disulfide isomerase
MRVSPKHPENFSMRLTTLFASTALAFSLFAGPALTEAVAQSVTPAQKTEIEQLVRDYLLANPEIIREMAAKLEEKDKFAEEQVRTEGLKTNAKAVFALPGDAVIGNPKGDITIVEFMDYNCGWCKRSVGEMAELIKADPQVRVVLKEFPIFGAGSEYAARAALAAKNQNKYWELHQALFAHEGGQVEEAVVDRIAGAVGLDVAKMKQDMMAKDILETITANQELGRALAINGTPAFVIDSEVVPGYLPMAGLQEKLTAVRANGCKIC